jgi:GNAT superfamily N-acetyltransferase
MTVLTIHAISRAELAMGLDWAAMEGWNPGLQDENSFLAADPDGFLMGWLGDVPVGLISAVRYGSGFGFIGLYIVLPRFRGQGHGMALWRAGMHALQGRTVGLDGVVAQQDNYRKSGFTLAYNNVRYQGHSQGHSQRDDAIVPLYKIPLQELLRYDSAFFPDDRQAFLQRWVGQPQSIALGVLEAGQLVGYGVCRPCRTGYKIGPLCADRTVIAQRLFTALTGDLLTGLQLQFDIPEVNSAALALAKHHGMEPVFETARMYAGPTPHIDVGRLYGITSFELG